VSIDVKAYFRKLYFQEKAKKLDKKLLTITILAGKEDFWSAYPWAFKENTTTITTTDGQETVDLPYDFEGLLNVKERDTSDGFKLTKLSPSEYDRLIPYSEDLPNYIPHTYKVYYDRGNSTWRLALYPTPNGAITLYVSYHVLEDGGNIPQKYISALITSTAKYFFMPGSVSYGSAANAFDIEIEKLKKLENVDIEEAGKMLDSSDAPNLGVDWSEYMRVGLWH